MGFKIFKKKKKVIKLTPRQKELKKFAGEAYYKDQKKINKHAWKEGYFLDTSLSGAETKVFVNRARKNVVIAFRGTALNDKKRRFKDLRSDLAIATGFESMDPRFRQANRLFKKVRNKYRDYTIDTTGHSLGGQLATYVTRKNKNDVNENVSFSRGSGIAEPFRRRPDQTTDISHEKDIISLGARLSQGGRGQVVDKSHRWTALGAHDLSSLIAV